MRFQGLVLATLLGMLAAPQALGDGSARQALEARAARADAAQQATDELRDTWQAEYRTLLVNYQNARERSAEASYNWRSKRKRLRLRGEHKTDARAEIEASEEELAGAMEAIRSFRERARAGGAEPGWLYRVEDEFPDIASAIAAY